MYELVDQEGQSIVQPYSITETFSKYQGVDQIPPPFTVSIGANDLVQDTVYMGRNAPYCLGPEDHESFQQNFSVTVGGGFYLLTTTVSISRGRFSGIYRVDVSIINP